MTAETLEDRLGRPLVIDLCLNCQAFWFDGRESLQLSPASTLALFRIVGERSAGRPPAAMDRAACPRCGTPLRPTRDMVRSTRFEYLNCPAGHGRLTTFYNFLREKNFITPLSPQQVAELRQNVRSVNCSNCGAPVDLASGAACTHCGSPLSMLDMAQAEKMVTELRQSDRSKAPIDPALPLTLERTRREVQIAFDRFGKDASWFETAGSIGLVGAGLAAISRWLRDK